MSESNHPLWSDPNFDNTHNEEEGYLAEILREKDTAELRLNIEKAVDHAFQACETHYKDCPLKHSGKVRYLFYKYLIQKCISQGFFRPYNFEKMISLWTENTKKYKTTKL